MENFNDINALYKRLKPALSSKIRELNNKGYPYIKEEDIWNYLSKKKWAKCVDLSLYNMVDDIFNINDYEINEYVLGILKEENRNIEEMDVL